MNEIRDKNGNCYYLESNKYYSLSRETIINIDMLYDAARTMFKYGVGCQGYVDLYNERHHEQIESVQKILLNSGIKSVGHHGLHLELKDEMLLNAVFNYFIIQSVYIYKMESNPFIKIEKEQILIYKKKKEFMAELFKKSGPKIYIYRYGHIAYEGLTEFSLNADDIYIGIEFNHGIGTMNGSLFGKQYFVANDNHGLLIKKSYCTKADPPKPKKVNEHSLVFDILYGQYFDDGLPINTMTESMPVIYGQPLQGMFIYISIYIFFYNCHHSKGMRCGWVMVTKRYGKIYVD